MQSKKFITLDIEGDASVSQCRSLFPDANHFDHNTIPWCITIVTDKSSVTFVCKLPAKPREYIVDNKPSGIYTKTYHELRTVVPVGNIAFTYEGIHYQSKIIECKSVKELMMKVSMLLQVCKSNNMTCYSKPFYEYLYDKDLLSLRFADYNLDAHCLDVIKPHNCRFESYMQRMQLCDNQTFMNTGIRHNIVDAVKLYECVKKDLK